MKIKHKINDIVYLCPNASEPDKIEVRLVLKVEFKKELKEIFYTLDNGKEYTQKETLTIDEVKRLNPHYSKPYTPKF